MLLQHADKRRAPIIESYNSMTHSPLVYWRHCSKKPLLDRYVLRAEVQSLSWLLGYRKIQKKLEETYQFPIYLPWHYAIPVWNFMHTTSKELLSHHYWACSLFSPSVMNRSKCHWCHTLRWWKWDVRFCCVCQQKPEQEFFAATNEPFVFSARQNVASAIRQSYHFGDSDIPNVHPRNP